MDHISSPLLLALNALHDMDPNFVAVETDGDSLFTRVANMLPIMYQSIRNATEQAYLTHRSKRQAKRRIILQRQVLQQDVIPAIRNLPGALPLHSTCTLIEGFAGSGKTTALAALVAAHPEMFVVQATTRKLKLTWDAISPDLFTTSNHDFKFKPSPNKVLIVDEALLNSRTRKGTMRDFGFAVHAHLVLICDRNQNQHNHAKWLPKKNPSYLWRTYRKVPFFFPLIYPRLVCLGGYSHFSFTDKFKTNSQFIALKPDQKEYPISGVKNSDGFSYASLQGLNARDVGSSIHLNTFGATNPSLLYIACTRGFDQITVPLSIRGQIPTEISPFTLLEHGLPSSCLSCKDAFPITTPFEIKPAVFPRFGTRDSKQQDIQVNYLMSERQACHPGICRTDGRYCLVHHYFPGTARSIIAVPKHLVKKTINVRFIPNESNIIDEFSIIPGALTQFVHNPKCIPPGKYAK